MPTFWTPDNLTTTQQFERARAKLYHDAPIIGAALADLPTIIHEESLGDFDTAWVDGKNIHWCLPFFNKLTNEERMFIYAHEIMHWLLGHFWRRGHRNMLKSNIAMDYAINAMLEEDYGSIMKRPNDTLWDSQYKGLSFEQIYEMLPTELDKQPQPGQGQKGKGQQGWGHHDAWGKDIGEDGTATDMGDDGEGINGKGFVDMEQKWEGKLVEAINFAKLMGNAPAGFMRQVGPLLNPKLPLRRLLLPYLSAGANDYTMTPTDRRFTHANVFLPSPFDEENIEGFVAAFDLSGSISDEDVAGYMSEMQQMQKLFPKMQGYAMFGDARVHNFIKIDGKPPKRSDYKGGGGTDFRPFYEYLKEKKITPKVMILFTDCYGSWPDKKPRYPHITISSSDEVAPFGKTVHYVGNNR